VQAVQLVFDFRSTKKENFQAVNGDIFLKTFKTKLGSWITKDKTQQPFRHFGPMAQEIFHYFGNEELAQ
jgi:hypothetical protein